MDALTDLIEGFPDATVTLGNTLVSEFVRTGRTPPYVDVVESYEDGFE
jgi:hypothetical protein